MKTLIEHKEILKIRAKPDWLENLVINEGNYSKFDLKDILNKVISGECLKAMVKIPSEIADLVFVDPHIFFNCRRKNYYVGLEAKLTVLMKVGISLKISLITIILQVNI